MDRPFNLLPSLHITLRTILAATYAAPHARRCFASSSSIWFSLIGFSTLLMHQHHVVDVIGGFILATACFYLGATTRRCGCRWCGTRASVGSMRRSALCLAVLCCLTWPWGAILVWPIVAVAIVTLGYFHSGPGHLSQDVWPAAVQCEVVILAPVLAGPVCVVAVLQAAMPRLGRDRAGRVDWSTAERRGGARSRESGSHGCRSICPDAFSEARPFIERAYCHLPVLDLTAPDARPTYGSRRFHRGARAHAESSTSIARSATREVRRL